MNQYYSRVLIDHDEIDTLSKNLAKLVRGNSKVNIWMIV